MHPNRHIRRERHRRQYTFTRTKMIVGFLLSLFFSVILDEGFDSIVKNSKELIRRTMLLSVSQPADPSSTQGDPTQAQSPAQNPQQGSQKTSNPVSEIEKRVQRL